MVLDLVPGEFSTSYSLFSSNLTPIHTALNTKSDSLKSPSQFSPWSDLHVGAGERGLKLRSVSILNVEGRGTHSSKPQGRGEGGGWWSWLV